MLVAKYAVTGQRISVVFGRLQMFDAPVAHDRTNQIRMIACDEWNRPEHPSSRPKHAGALPKSRQEVRNVLEHVERNDRIEAVLGKGQPGQVLVANSARIGSSKRDR